MGTEARGARFALASASRRALAILAVATVGALAVACSETAPSAAPAPDASAPDAGPVVMTEDGTCVSTFQVSSDCVHPTVVKQCDGEFCRIPRGCFVQGSPECLPWRGLVSEPEVQVTLTHDFEVSRHETTQGEWVSMGLLNPSRPPPDGSGALGDCSQPTCPVTNISWFEALHYANARSRAKLLPECYELVGCTGQVGSLADPLTCKGVVSRTPSIYDCVGYRLTTDSEWEYAARAGTRTPFYTGVMRATINRCVPEPALDSAAWYCDNVRDRTMRPVEGKVPNAWGLFDVLGNAWEWTSDESRARVCETGRAWTPARPLARPASAPRGVASPDSGPRR